MMPVKYWVSMRAVAGIYITLAAHGFAGGEDPTDLTVGGGASWNGIHSYLIAHELPPTKFKAIEKCYHLLYNCLRSQLGMVLPEHVALRNVGVFCLEKEDLDLCILHELWIGTEFAQCGNLAELVQEDSMECRYLSTTNRLYHYVCNASRALFHNWTRMGAHFDEMGRHCVVSFEEKRCRELLDHIIGRVKAVPLKSGCKTMRTAHRLAVLLLLSLVAVQRCSTSSLLILRST
uniref:Uncharacterized protein n=1 Tax=Trichuris muris TaxID=70415 RepID=A0A5S6QDC2_TRIMR